MARSIRSSTLETRSARLKLPIAKKPIFLRIAPGVGLGYRRNRTAGTWVARVADGRGANWTKGIGSADDFDEADGAVILDFWQAQEKARIIGRDDPGAGSSKPLTVAQALDAYEAFLSRADARANELEIEKVNLRLPSLRRQIRRGEGVKPDKKWVAELMGKIGLENRRDHRPSELSGGQQQRVAIGRALVSKPTIVFADEPTGNLDSKTSGEILELMRDSVDTYGQTTVMVTHDPRAAAIADRILFLADGLIVNDLGRSDAREVIAVMEELAR